MLDEGNREALAVEAVLSLPAARVTQVLNQLVALHGVRGALRCDNGPEFVSVELATWCRRHGVRLLHIQPGKPNEKAYIERFNGSSRKEVLDAYFRGSLEDARAETSVDSRSTKNAAATRQPRPGPTAHLPAEVNCSVPVPLQPACPTGKLTSAPAVNDAASSAGVLFHADVGLGVAYPPEIRRLLYTTNAIESLHMQLRRIVKTRGHLPTDEAATKLLYLALRSIPLSGSSAAIPGRAPCRGVHGSWGN